MNTTTKVLLAVVAIQMALLGMDLFSKVVVTKQGETTASAAVLESSQEYKRMLKQKTPEDELKFTLPKAAESSSGSIRRQRLLKSDKKSAKAASNGDGTATTKAPKSTKAPTLKSTKAPSLKSTKAPSISSKSSKSTKAPSISSKSTKAPSISSKSSKSSGNEPTASASPTGTPTSSPTIDDGTEVEDEGVVLSSFFLTPPGTSSGVVEEEDFEMRRNRQRNLREEMRQIFEEEEEED